MHPNKRTAKKAVLGGGDGITDNKWDLLPNLDITPLGHAWHGRGTDLADRLKK